MALGGLSESLGELSERLGELSGGRTAGLLEATSSGLTHSCNDGLIGRALCHTALRLFGAHRLPQHIDRYTMTVTP